MELYHRTPGKGVQWGNDLIDGFVGGIKSFLHKVRDTISDAADIIKQYIHFSRPDIGPLRMYEQWMPDFIAGLSRGITDNLWMVEDAAERLSGATAEPMQAMMKPPRLRKPSRLLTFVSLPMMLFPFTHLAQIGLIIPHKCAHRNCCLRPEPDRNAKAARTMQNGANGAGGVLIE